MTKNSDRRYAKRNMRSAYRHMDTVMDILLTMKRMFEDDHPDLAQQLDVICQTQLFVQQMVSKWYENVWGTVPGNWSADV